MRTGFDTVLKNRGAEPSGPLPGALEVWSGENGVRGDLDTAIGVACCTVADCNSSMKPSLSRMLMMERRLSLSGPSRSVRIGPGTIRLLGSMPAASPAASPVPASLSFSGTGGAEFPTRHESTFEVWAMIGGMVWVATDFVSCVENLERGIRNCGEGAFS